MLAIPRYIENAKVQEQPIEYKWKPYLGMEIIEKYSSNIKLAVDEISLRATLTLGLGVAEWMTWRLNGRSQYQQVYLYVDALWARTVDRHYLKVDELKRPADTGDPIIGPLRALEHALADMITKTLVNHPERAKTIAQLVSLVRYTLVNRGEFDEWLKAAIARFVHLYAFDPQNVAGGLVPRSFLDPQVEPATENIPALLDEQLRSIDYSGNPFLATPEEMRAAGFKGTPYRYLP